MEVDWVCQRMHLYRLLRQHPEWSQQQLADAVGCSKSMVNKWKKLFPPTTTPQASLFTSRSRAPRRHPPRISRQVVERILELRLAPPENLKRTPGPKALLYYLHKDEQVQQLSVPRSTRTVWRILDAAGLIERDPPRKRKPLPAVDPLEEVQVDFKDVGHRHR